MFTSTFKQKHAAPEQQLEKPWKGKKDCRESADKKSLNKMKQIKNPKWEFKHKLHL